MILVGIDPGKKGAVVALNQSGGVEFTAVMKDVSWFADQIEALKKSAENQIKVYLERAQAMPKNGAVSMFNYGVGYGELIGVLVALQIPFETVPPAVWTKTMHQSKKDTLTPKARSLQAAQRLFPTVSLKDPHSSDRAKKPHEGIVDALLIAEYGRRLTVKGHLLSS